jgi:hypothetical protein
MTILNISELNKGWGICGFASSLGALYQNGFFSKTIDRAVSQNQLNTRLLAEIKTYLVILQAENKILLLNEIESFTKSFGGNFSNFTIKKYIEKINSIAASPPNLKDERFSIAMPPNGVVDYLIRICNMKNPLLKECRYSASDNVILGLADSTQTGGGWKGLRHWVYKKNNSEIFNWGKKETLSELLAHDANWRILYEIKLS